MTPFQSIPISAIQIGKDRRPLDSNWVEGLAEMIAEQGLINPISVMPIEGGFKLITGHHRLAAFKLLKHDEIAAHIREYSEESTSYIKLEELAENLFRNELTALDRAQAIFDLDAVYKDLYPELKQGGDQKNKEAENQTAILAVRSGLLEKVGLSERSFRRAKAIWKGLSKPSIARIYGTWMADHQASLMLLAEQKPKIQDAVLNYMFTGSDVVGSVAEALALVNGERIIPANEKRIASTQSNLVAMSKQERIAVLSGFEDEIREIAQMNGWL